MEDIIAKVQELVAAFGIKVATALLVLVIGRWVAKYLRDLTGKMMGKSNTNYTMKEKRRVDLVFGVSYGEEIEKVKRVIAGVLGATPVSSRFPPRRSPSWGSMVEVSPSPSARGSGRRTIGMSISTRTRT